MNIILDVIDGPNFLKTLEKQIKITPKWIWKSIKRFFKFLKNWVFRKEQEENTTTKDKKL